MKLVIGIRSRILLTAAISAFVLTTMASVVMVETFLRLILEESTKRLLVDSDAGACGIVWEFWTNPIGQNRSRPYYKRENRVGFLFL